MKDLTLEWVRYAEDDYSAVEQLFITGKKPLYGIVCFHAQQCIEKYLKSYLTEHDILFERTHNLTILLDLLLPLKAEWNIHRDALGILTNFAVLARYPEELPINRKVTENAVGIMLEMREIVRTALEA